MIPKPEPEPEDRLSLLPDHLLHHIFSFIDSLYLLQSSLLSRRWRLLHASIPTLSFSFTNYCHRFNQPGSDTRFSMLIGACLAARDKTLPVFDFCYDAADQIVEPETVEALVAAALELGVRRLQLTSDLVMFRLPGCLYLSRSLKELTLQSRFISLSNELGFPTLTKLHLQLFQFSDAKFNTRILSRCPNLQTLILRDCNIDDQTKEISISAPKLAKLEISYSLDLWYIPVDCEFAITAPNLAFFRYSGIRALNCILNCPRSLDEVEIDVFEGKDELYDGGAKLNHKIDKVSGLIRMLGVFKWARTIRISKATKKCLSQAPGLGMRDIHGGLL